MEDNRGEWTLAKIAYAIKNNLEAGLKGTSNFPFSIEQLEQEVISSRNALINELKLQQIFFDLIPFEQEINCIKLDCEDIGLCCDKPTKETVLHFKLPRVISYSYLGLATQRDTMKVYTGTAFKYNKYRDFNFSKRPYIWLRTVQDTSHGFLFNPPSPHLKYVSFRGVLENPLDVNDYDCCGYDPEKDTFPAPNWAVTKIIDATTAKWASWYYKFQGQKVNNQTPLV